MWLEKESVLSTFCMAFYVNCNHIPSGSAADGNQLDAAGLEQDEAAPPPARAQATVQPPRPQAVPSAPRSQAPNAREPPPRPSEDNFDYEDEADYPDTRRPVGPPQGTPLSPLQGLVSEDPEDYPNQPISRPRPTVAAGFGNSFENEEDTAIIGGSGPAVAQRPRPTQFGFLAATAPGGSNSGLNRPQVLPQQQLEEADFRSSPQAAPSVRSDRPSAPAEATTLLPVMRRPSETAPPPTIQVF